MTPGVIPLTLSLYVIPAGCKLGRSEVCQSRGREQWRLVLISLFVLTDSGIVCVHREVFFSPETRLKWLQGYGSSSACWGGSAARFWSLSDPAPFLHSLCSQLLLSICFLVTETLGGLRDGSSPTCLSDHLFSYAPQLAEGAAILRKRTREA